MDAFETSLISTELVKQTADYLINEIELVNVVLPSDWFYDIET